MEKEFQAFGGEADEANSAEEVIELGRATQTNRPACFLFKFI